jgi:hypothetical protein
MEGDLRRTFVRDKWMTGEETHRAPRSGLGLAGGAKSSDTAPLEPSRGARFAVLITIPQHADSKEGQWRYLTAFR